MRVSKILMLLGTTEAFLAPTTMTTTTKLWAGSPIDTVGDWLEQLAEPPVVTSNKKKGVVITGGANGVGYAYAEELLKRCHGATES